MITGPSPIRVTGGAAESGEAFKIPPLASNMERYGEGGARILAAGLFDEQGQSIESIESKGRVHLRMMIQAERELSRTNLGFMLRDKKGLDVTGSNLAFEGTETPHLAAGKRLQAEFRIDLPELPSGSYSFCIAVAEGDASEYRTLDWVENACILQLHSVREVLGHIRLVVEPIVNQPNDP